MRFGSGEAVHSCLWVAILSLCVAGVAFGGPITAIDQENPGPFKWTNTGLAGRSFGQSFTPTLSGIDAFECLIAGNAATVVIRLRDGVAGTDGLDGALIAESLPTLVNGSTATFHFDFAGTVPLTPSNTYVAELYIASGTLYTRCTDDTYAGGQFLHGGFSQSSFRPYDMVFAEGLHTTAVPAPAALALVGLALPGLWGLRRRRAL